MNTEELIKRAIEIHGDEYSYEHTVFVNWNTKVIVTCKIHGDFEISPRGLIYKKNGCKECRGRHISEAKRIKQVEFLGECHRVHGDRYIYNKAIYLGSEVECEIICRKHGPFWQTPYNHIRKGCGCPRCRYDNLSKRYRLSLDTLKEKIEDKHGTKYEYPNLEEEYENNRSIITICCPIHGEFKQSVMKHLVGHGCPLCKQSKLESEISAILTKNDIEFIPQKDFDWLIHEKPLYLDFYLPKYNIAIECQGEQHYMPIAHFGGDEEFISTVNRDKSKKECCDKNGVKLLYYTKFKNINGENIYKNKNNLLKEILEYGNDRRT